MDNIISHAGDGTVGGGLGVSEVEAKTLGEIRGKMVLAKQFPRDLGAAIERILLACRTVKVAEQALYSFPRGDSEVTGASIRLMELIAANVGNFTCGITELDRRPGESTVKAYAWDLETNFSDEKVFTVSHVRKTKTKTYQLEDPRDIYELVANQGARRKRACIQAVVPQYIVDIAIEQCKKTLEDSIAEEGIETVREKILSAFSSIDERVTEEVLSQKVGKPFDALSKTDIVTLRKLFMAIKDGFTTTEKALFSGDKDAQVNTVEQDELNDIVSAALGSPADSAPKATDGRKRGTKK